jgi:hypothetical protein
MPPTYYWEQLAYQRTAISRITFLNLARAGVIPRVWRQIQHAHKGAPSVGWAYPAPAIEALAVAIDRFADLMSAAGDDPYMAWWEATVDCRDSPAYAEPLAYCGDLDIIEIVCTQMTKTDLLAGRRGRDDIADLDIAVRHDHPINQQLDEVTLLLKGGLGQPSL